MKQKSDKIGIGVLTRNRPDFFKKCIESIPPVDVLIVINDGNPYNNSIYPESITKVIQNKYNKGISRSKNIALKYLMNQGCKHLFLCEDDIALKDPIIVDKYIEASYESGIFHFNYGFHGRWNRDSDGQPKHRLIVNYKNVSLAFNRDLTGAFSYYRDVVINKVGYMDEFYRNVLEHVDHTFKIIKHNFHPPQYWFADIANSFDYIIELDPALNSSLNTKNKSSYILRTKIFTAYFILKHGKKPYKFNDTSEEELKKIITEMQNKNGGV